MRVYDPAVGEAYEGAGLGRREGEIKAGDPAWSDHVPAEVANVIRRRGFLGHKRANPAKETGNDSGIIPRSDEQDHGNLLASTVVVV